MPYAELIITTNFTCLAGASQPEEMIQRAAEYGLAALAYRPEAGTPFRLSAAPRSAAAGRT